MTIRKAPINDLLFYLDEKGDSFEKKKNFLNFILEHYKKLTNITIKTSNERAMSNLCFCDTGKIKNNNFPVKEGILLKNNKNEFGITFLFTHRTEEISLEHLQVWKIDNKGCLIYENLNLNEWEEWGALTALYNYPSYEEGININLGDRDLKEGIIGKDVLQFQIYLSHYGVETSLNGEFDSLTVEALKKVQELFGSKPTGKIRKENIDFFIR